MYDRNQYENVVTTYQCIYEEKADKKRYKYLNGIVNFKFISISGLLLLLALWVCLFFVLILSAGLILEGIGSVVSFNQDSIVLANDIASLILIPGYTILLPIISLLEPLLLDVLQLIVPTNGILYLPNIYQPGSTSVYDFWAKVFLGIIIYGEIAATAVFIIRRIKKLRLKRKSGDVMVREMELISQNSQERQNWLHTYSIVPSGLWDLEKLGACISYMDGGRAGTFQEAVNLYYYEIREAQRQAEEKRYRNEQLWLERDKINAINDLKNEQKRIKEELEWQNSVIWNNTRPR